MNAVKIFILAFCIYQISAETLEEILVSCRKEAKIEKEAVSYLFQHGSWPEGITTAGCYCNCVGKKLDVVDSSGMLIQNKLIDAASKHPKVKEFDILISSFSKCTTQATGPSECAVTESFIVCAMKNSTKQ